jgi:hypothetical protein
MPVNMVIANPPMIIKVMAALRDLGLRKAGTPLLIASTPVSAVQPEANARSASSTVRYPPTGWLAVRCSAAPDANFSPPPAVA